VPKTILITGAGLGFGESAAIGMAKNGHTVIATVQVSPQVTPLREKAKATGLSDLRVERLDLTDPYDIAQAQTFDIDVLWNNASMGEAGPVFASRNKAIVKASFEAWASGAGSPYNLLADDASWSIVGHSAASKTYPSKEAFRREVIRPFNARMNGG
jgi:NAD(P)-dependent dehydrogenase (short-subunit alcohol dehydrogenase family)